MPLIRLFRIVNGLLLTLVLVTFSHFGAGERAAYLRAQEGAHALLQWRSALQVVERLSEESMPLAAANKSSLGEELKLRNELAQLRRQTDDALAALSAHVNDSTTDAFDDQARRALARVGQVLAATRSQIDASAGDPARQAALVMAQSRLGAATQEILPLADSYALETMGSDPEQHAVVQAAQGLVLVHQSARALEALLIPPLRRREAFRADESAAIERLRGRLNLLREFTERQVELLAPVGELGRAEQRVRAGFWGQTDALLGQIVKAGTGTGLEAVPYPVDAEKFELRFQSDLVPLLTLRDGLLDEALARSERRRAEVRHNALWAALILLSVGTCLAFTMRLLHTRVIRPLSEASRAIHEIAAGDTDVEMPSVQRQDEVGEVLGALQSLQSSQRHSAQLAAERDALIGKLRALSSTDPLTGLLNRRAFFETAERELANALRHGYDVSVLLMDVDHFKSINDEHGHAAGDQALVAMASCLQASLRQGDVLARHGGEEFVILLTHCARLSAVGFAERLRQTVSEMQLGSLSEGYFNMTISLGVAASGDNGWQLSGLLSQADAAMYCAKRAGRDRVMAAPALSGGAGATALLSSAAKAPL